MTSALHAALCVVGVSLGLSLGASGCLVGELGGVPCRKDDQCPTSHFCDIPNDVCVSTGNGDAAPDLVVVGVRDAAGEVGISPFVAPDVTSTLGLVIENRSPAGPGRAADDVVVEMTELACMNLDVDVQTVPAAIAPGATAEIEFNVRPDDCGTPAIQDWFLFYSGRAKRGTFNINIRSQAPVGD